MIELLLCLAPINLPILLEALLADLHELVYKFFHSISISFPSNQVLLVCDHMIIRLPIFIFESLEKELLESLLNYKYKLDFCESISILHRFPNLNNRFHFLLISFMHFWIPSLSKLPLIFMFQAYLSRLYVQIFIFTKKYNR